MRRCNRNQTDPDKVLDNNYYITSVLMIFTPKVILLHIYIKKLEKIKINLNKKYKIFILKIILIKK